MPSTLHSGSPRARNYRSRRFIARQLTLWLMLLILGTAVVLSSVLAGGGSKSSKSASGAAQKRDTKSVADVLNERRRAKLEHNGNSDVSRADRDRLRADLFMNPPAPPVGTTMAATSSATPEATPNNEKGATDPGGMQQGSLQSNEPTVQIRGERDDVRRRPREESLTRARSFNGDLRKLRYRKPPKRERPELEGPEPDPTFYLGTPPPSETPQSVAPSVPDLNAPTPNVQAPSPSIVFEGLDRETWGAGSPPDTTGDVGPTYYIQSVNTSVGIYRKSDGFREAAFTFDTLMSQGNQGNLCDNHNFGDPVVLYDTFEDRWILTDFAFLTDVSGNVLSPAYQCFAVSMNGNPLTGGWNFYSIQVADFLNDYPKLGVWPDGLYMSANMFSFGAGSTFQGVRVWALNKAQMYAGSPTVKVVSFHLGTGDFTVVPANARLQTGTPPAGRPNLFLSTWNFLNAVSVYKFHVDWNSISLSTFTGPDVAVAATSWPNATPANAPQSGTATLLDVLAIRAMVQNQYTNFGGTESLWVPHTVRRANTTGFAAPRWYQVNTTGGTVAPNLPQAATWDPDAANVIHRFMPSLALDRGGNMAMGYTTSNSSGFPSMKYAGRLSTDPVNTFGQTEQTLFSGTASQTGSTRWGDYSSMMLDPDGCTFWYTNEYANPLDQSFNKRWMTKIGSFKFGECTPVGAGGTVSGTLANSATSNPISGAIVALGSRTTTTDGSGAYTFSNLPAGVYPSITASFAGYGSSTAIGIVVTDGGTTTQDFSLTTAPASVCLTDTTQADFLLGVSTNVDVNTSPGDVTLIDLAIDQQNTAGTTTGTGFGTPAWNGQIFTPTVNGQLVAADIQVFCNGCGATPPNLTLSVRNTAAGLPTGADLASVTIAGSVFASGATVTFKASFGSPATLTSGTQYALILRPVSVPAGSGYFWIRSSPSTYASGSRVLSADSGGTWSTDTTRDYNFKTYMRGPYSPTSGNVVSGTRDANPAAGLTPIWSTVSWNATTPANSSLKFQLAGSNNVNGPFNFVGPDGTAGTFFTTSPVQLSPQFYGLRFLEYKALLSTTDNAVTPTLNDVTLCFADVDCSGTTPTITPNPAQVCANSTSNAASGPAGMTAYAWGITNGTITSSTSAQSVTYTAGASGRVTLTLTVTTPSGCITPNSLMVPINPIPATPIITPGGPTTFCAGNSVTLTSSNVSGNQWYLNGNPIGGETNQAYIATAAGNYTNVVTTTGCSSAPSSATTVTVNPTPATPTITPGGPTTFCTGGSVTLTSNSASGNQWFLNGNPVGGATNQQYMATASGDYTSTVTASGCSSAPSSATTVTVNPIPATPTITPGGPTTFSAGGSVTLMSSSATGNQWYLNGNPIGGATAQTYIANSTGDYTVADTASGCTSAPSAATTVTVNPIPGTPTITPGSPTTFCAGGSVTLTSSSVAGNQWYLNGNPIGGATSQQYNAATSGNYTVTVTTSGAISAPSIATAVTANTAPTLTYPTPHTVTFGGSVNVAATPASGDVDGTVTYQVLAGHGLLTAPTVNASGGVSIANAQPAGAHNITVRATDNCGATADASFALQVQSPANVGGTKTVSGTFAPGGLITYTVTLSNSSAAPQLDNAGNEFTDVLPSSLTLVSANATSGSATTTTGTNTVTWNGSIAGSGLVTIAITATIKNVPDATTVSNQGMISFDADGNGTNEASRVTDDPSVAGATNPTSFTVGDVNDPPDAVDDTLTSVAEDSSMRTIAISSLLANDTNGPGNENGESWQTFTFTSVSSPVGGTVTSDATNVFFTPAADFNGTASFQYTVIDNGTTNGVADMKSDTATVSFLITEVNDAPVAVNDPLGNMAEDAPQRTIPFSALTNNDSKGAANESGQILIVKTVSNPIGLTVGIVAGTVRFTPLPDYSGPASFKYTVEDNGTTNGAPDLKTSGQALAHFNITEVNDVPTAVNDVLSNVTEDSGQRTISFADLTGNDTKGSANEPGQILIVKTVSNAVGGTASIVGGDVLFTPTDDYFGPASFQYTVEDNGMTSGTLDPKTSATPALVNFNITEVNDVPTAVNDTLPNIVEDSGPQTISFAILTANDSKGPANENSQTLTVRTVSNAVGGTVRIVAGNVVFTPTANYFGPASFDYTVEDNGTTNGVADPKTSGTATVTFANSAVADTPSVTNATTNANTQTTSGLVISRNPDDGAEVTNFKITAITGGLLFKNNGTTPINNGDFITFAEGNAGLKFTPGTTNGSFTVRASVSASDSGLGGETAAATIIINSLDGVIRFSAANFSVAESAGFKTITVERSGNTSQQATVDYASSDQSDPPDLMPCSSPGAGFASSRCDFTTAMGTLRFAAGETSKTFNVLINQDSYVEGPETLSLTLSNPTGGAVFGVPAAATLQITDDATAPATNPIDNSSVFVRAVYHDMLNREPDEPGLAFWTDNIEKCNDPARRPADQTVAQCTDKQREATAIAFFMSPEFQMTGGFVYRLYKGSLSGTPNYDGGTSESPGRFPTSAEFTHDMGQVSEGIVASNQLSGAVIEANRNRLAAEFVLRPEFVAKYGGLNNTLYVQELFNTSGLAVTAAEKQSLTEGLTNGTETRASVLRKVVDGTVVTGVGNVQFMTPYAQAFINQENRRLFVYMEYVGYLRRNPDAAGFIFWLGKLNFFNGDPFEAEMVRSFILSPEYRSRFGQP